MPKTVALPGSPMAALSGREARQKAGSDRSSHDRKTNTSNGRISGIQTRPRIPGQTQSFRRFNLTNKSQELYLKWFYFVFKHYFRRRAGGTIASSGKSKNNIKVLVHYFNISISSQRQLNIYNPFNLYTTSSRSATS